MLLCGGGVLKMVDLVRRIHNISSSSLSIFYKPNLNGRRLAFSTCCSRVPRMMSFEPIRIPIPSTNIKDKEIMIIGHRGNGMNILDCDDYRMTSIKENSILSFQAASHFPIHFIEFDVQVTKDHCPVIFHDDFILSRHNGTVFEKRITELTLSQLLSYGPQKHTKTITRPLLRKTSNGRILNWNVRTDDSLCTLQEAFHSVHPSLGFNIELKFDDHIAYPHHHLLRLLETILHVVFYHANDRPIIFSTFHPDAALLARQLQTTYPVFFLTDGGSELYNDARRNSLEEALKLCVENNLQGIVSEVKGIFRNPGMIKKIKDSQLSLFTYGKLNNVAQVVYMQHLMGVEGVVVDLVKEITEAMCGIIKPMKIGEQESFSVVEGEMLGKKPQFSERGVSFLLKLFPELINL